MTGQPKRLFHVHLVNLQSVLVGLELLSGRVQPPLSRLLNLRHVTVVDGDEIAPALLQLCRRQFPGRDHDLNFHDAAARGSGQHRVRPRR